MIWMCAQIVSSFHTLAAKSGLAFCEYTVDVVQAVPSVFLCNVVHMPTTKVLLFPNVWKH